MTPFQEFLEEEKKAYYAFSLFKPFCESLVDIYLDPNGVRFWFEDLSFDTDPTRFTS